MKIFSLITLLLLSVTALGQFMQQQDQAHFSNKPQGYMTSLPAAPPGQVGSFYMHEEFNKADIFLKDSTKLSDLLVRFDARSNLFEIKLENVVKMLPVGQIMFATVKTSAGVTEKFINSDLLKISENPFGGGKLLQIHYEGNVSLLSRILATIKQANSNPNPMSNVVVQRDNEIILETLYFIAAKDTFIDASQSRSKFRHEVIDVFGDEVESLVKQTNNKNFGDLSALVMELDNRSKPK